MLLISKKKLGYQQFQVRKSSEDSEINLIITGLEECNINSLMGTINCIQINSEGKSYLQDVLYGKYINF